MAQQFRVAGRGTDEDGVPIPFASVYLKDAGICTAAPRGGEFQLRLPIGTNTLQVRAVGFRQVALSISADEQKIIVVLPREAYVL